VRPALSPNNKPVPPGSGETEPAPPGSGEVESVPSGSDEVGPSLEGLGETIIMPLTVWAN
jgi:hypothetical protein